ncbi:STAS domain-containing protein [Bacillus timonensis]|nr:STAS domain-containing protein [Bacillus timonensis]
MNIGIDVKRDNKSVYVFINGEIDAYTAPKLKEQLLPITQENSVNMIADLTGVTYMDSTGLGVFIGVLKSLKKQNGSLALTGLSDRLLRLFDITGLSEIIEIKTKLEGGVK